MFEQTRVTAKGGDSNDMHEYNWKLSIVLTYLVQKDTWL